MCCANASVCFNSDVTRADLGAEGSRPGVFETTYSVCIWRNSNDVSKCGRRRLLASLFQLRSPLQAGALEKKKKNVIKSIGFPPPPLSHYFSLSSPLIHINPEQLCFTPHDESVYISKAKARNLPQRHRAGTNLLSIPSCKSHVLTGVNFRTAQPAVSTLCTLSSVSFFALSYPSVALCGPSTPAGFGTLQQKELSILCRVRTRGSSSPDSANNMAGVAAANTPYSSGQRLSVSKSSESADADGQEQRLRFHPRCCEGPCGPCRGRCYEADLREVITRLTGRLRAKLISHRWTHVARGPGHADVRVGVTRANRARLQSLTPVTTVRCVNMSISKI
ncbi:uncharacterized [Tachysurus ichikawai]